MREALLRRNITIIAVVSVVLAGLITLIMKLKFFDTVNADLTRTASEYTTAQTTGKKLADNLKALRIAENNAVFAQDQTNVFRQRFRSLAFDVDQSNGPGPLQATWRRYLNEYYTDYGVELRRVLIQAADESGVIIDTAVKVQAPPQNPEDVTSPPGGFMKPLSDASASATVRGPLPNVLRFFERINQSEVLMTAGAAGAVGVRVETDSLGVRATFNLTPYLVVSGPSALLPPAAAAPSTTGTVPGTSSGGSSSGLNSAVSNSPVSNSSASNNAAR